MTGKGNKRIEGSKKKRGTTQSKRKKRGPVKLESDQDFLKVFAMEEQGFDPAGDDKKTKKTSAKKKNRHGLDILDDLVSDSATKNSDDETQLFETLLEESFSKTKASSRPNYKPVPLKKRLKRYPPVEKKIDLHGMTGIQAQTRARSFIQTCKEQGLFTIRVVVGKGLHSSFGPVLPDLIEDLVNQMKKEGTVLWFEWDNKIKSKSGSLVIYLKQFEAYD